MKFESKVKQGNMIMIRSYNMTADFSIIKECMIMFHHYNLVKLKNEKVLLKNKFHVTTESQDSEIVIRSPLAINSTIKNGL